MINKEKNDKEEPISKKEGFTDVAKMNMQAHILIKDKDTGKVLVNKRG